MILFTAEPYDEKKFIYEQQAGSLAVARCFAGADELFGIAPEFIRPSMEGSFEGATIVLMGCEGLGSEETAQSFVEKGAHTDAATEDLIELLVSEELPPAEAVAATMEEVGPDPTYGSQLHLLQ